MAGQYLWREKEIPATIMSFGPGKGPNGVRGVDQHSVIAIRRLTTVTELMAVS